MLNRLDYIKWVNLCLGNIVGICGRLPPAFANFYTEVSMAHAYDTCQRTLCHCIYAQTNIRCFPIWLIGILVREDISMPFRKSPNVCTFERILCAHLLQMNKKLYNYFNDKSHLLIFLFTVPLLSCIFSSSIFFEFSFFSSYVIVL